MPQYQVIITDFIEPPLTMEEAVLRDLATTTALTAHHEEELAGRIEEADAIMLYHYLSLSRKTIESLKQCKLIVRCGVGFDNVDLQAARERGIPVANVPDYGTEEVADSAIGMALTLLRGIHYMNCRLQRNAGVWSYAQVVPTHRLRDRVFGILGLGRIGTATALRARGLGMRVVCYDPYIPDGTEKSLGIQRVDTLEELLRMADVVSVHCPRSSESSHLINDDTLALMKPSSFLINTARGGVVDSGAVLRAIESGHLRGAGLDVLEIEPPDQNDPLISAWRDPNHPAHDRVVINPHAAFYSEEGLADMRTKGAENCRRVLLGQSPRNVVN